MMHADVHSADFRPLQRDPSKAAVLTFSRLSEMSRVSRTPSPKYVRGLGKVNSSCFTVGFVRRRESTVM